MTLINLEVFVASFTAPLGQGAKNHRLQFSHTYSRVESKGRGSTSLAELPESSKRRKITQPRLAGFSCACAESAAVLRFGIHFRALEDLALLRGSSAFLSF